MKSKNILIVENKEQDRKLMEYLIGQVHTFQSFDQGTVALSQLANQNPDLILVSLQLLDIEPNLFLQKLKALGNHSCQVVGLISSTEEQQIPYFRALGFEKFISKPIRPKEFIPKIQSLLVLPEKTEANEGEKPSSSPILNPEIYHQLLRLSSKEVILQVFLDFAEECENLLQLLERSRAIETTEEITRAIHTLKGNSGTLGLDKLYVAAKHSESLGKQEKSIEFAESLHYLKARIKEFQEFLKNEQSLNNV
jgi:CheY-like chemotaxis protein/HPt (histidine-containing phosphotransfer) domain-containing protein